MAFAALLVVTLVSLGSASRLSDQDHLEPAIDGQMDVDVGSNVTDTADGEWPSINTCCCYHPWHDKYKSNPKKLRSDKCPAEGCLTPPRAAADDYW
eukprot:4143474-Amphidinium_carterae.1